MNGGWTKKIKGCAVIYTHPDALYGRAIVVNMYGISFNGVEYATLAEAKTSALSSTDREPRR